MKKAITIALTVVASIITSNVAASTEVIPSGKDMAGKMIMMAEIVEKIELTDEQKKALLEMAVTGKDIAIDLYLEHGESIKDDMKSMLTIDQVKKLDSIKEEMRLQIKNGIEKGSELNLKNPLDKK